METSSKILMLYDLLQSQKIVRTTIHSDTSSKILILYELLNSLPPKAGPEVTEKSSMKKVTAQRKAAIRFISEKLNDFARRAHNIFGRPKEEKNTLLQVSIILDKLLVSYLENNVKVLSDNDEARCIHNHVQNVMLHCKDILFRDGTLVERITQGLMKDDLAWWRFIILLALFLRQIDSGNASVYSSEEYAQKVVKYLDTQNGWEHLQEYLKIQKLLQDDFQDNVKGVVRNMVILAIFLISKI